MSKFDDLMKRYPNTYVSEYREGQRCFGGYWTKTCFQVTVSLPGGLQFDCEICDTERKAQNAAVRWVASRDAFLKED